MIALVGPAKSQRVDLFRIWCMRHYADRWRARGARDAIRYLVKEIRRIEHAAAFHAVLSEGVDRGRASSGPCAAQNPARQPSKKSLAFGVAAGLARPLSEKEALRLREEWTTVWPDVRETFARMKAEHGGQ